MVASGPVNTVGVRGYKVVQKAFIENPILDALDDFLTFKGTLDKEEFYEFGIELA